MQITAVTGGSFDPYGYSGIDDLFAQAVATDDAQERARLAADMERKLREDLLPMTPGMYQDNAVWQNNRITGSCRTRRRPRPGRRTSWCVGRAEQG
jgi:peptide/nickel transport system substrate-binding protein